MVRQAGQRREHDPAPSPPTLPPLSAISRLTAREREILGFIGQAMENRLIARALFRSPITIACHVKAIHRKLRTKNRSHLTAIAVVYGLGHPPAPK